MSLLYALKRNLPEALGWLITGAGVYHVTSGGLQLWSGMILAAGCLGIVLTAVNRRKSDG